jgi:signal transduction histidine kinase
MTDGTDHRACDRGTPIFSRRARWLGALWVVVSIALMTVASAVLVDDADSYVWVLVGLSCGAFTTPALWARWYSAFRYAEPRARLGALLSAAALATAFVIGVAMLVGLVTGWRWANPAGVPAVALVGVLHVLGLVVWTRLRSGVRALSVDVIEATTAVLAVTAPLVVIWGPALGDAEAPWFALPAATATVSAIACIYWTVTFFVRLGRGRRSFEGCAVAFSTLGALNAALQTAQGVTGFALPAPPLIAFNGLCFSMYLLVALNAPASMLSGFAVLPPQSQVRGGRLATVVTLTGLAALWVATLAVADAEPWAVTFSFVMVSLLLVLAGIRQMAAAQETRRLYRQVEDASDERRLLLGQLLERSVDDRRRFATELYARAVAAYTSFSNMIAGADMTGAASASTVAEVSAQVGGDLARQAQSVHELARAIRPLEGRRDQRERLGIPLRAYVATIYDDRTQPRLTIDVQGGPDVAFDWATETILLQIAQEALHNVRRHSQASAVEVAIHATGEGAVLRVADNGIGFDPAAVPEGMGIATMRAAVAVIEGTLVLDSAPGRGTTIHARLYADGPPNRPGGPNAPRLRVIRGDAGNTAPPPPP